MRRIFYIPLVLTLLAACQPTTPAATATPQVTTEVVPNTATVPTPTATEAPMATSTAMEKPGYMRYMESHSFIEDKTPANGYNLLVQEGNEWKFNVEDNPKITRQELMDGAAANSVLKQLIQDGIDGKPGAYFDRDGKLLVPPDVKPIASNEWEIFVAPMTNMQGLDRGVISTGPGNPLNLKYTPENSPVQKINQVYVLVGVDGKPTTMAIPQAIFIKDKEGKDDLTIAWTPLDIKTQRNIDRLTRGKNLFKFNDYLGHPSGGGQPSFILAFNLGLEPGGENSFINGFVNYDQYNNDLEMQPIRNAMIEAIKAGNFEPSQFFPIILVDTDATQAK